MGLTADNLSESGGIVVPTESLIARYELLRRLGRGGMAEVWLARAIGLRDFEKLLVLKRILRDKRDDPRFLGMMRDEARVAATLAHPNVVHTLDVGLEGDELFITMEYLHGRDVKSILKAAAAAGELMPLELAVQIAMGCAAGLHHAHEQTDSKGNPLNIVHRDVSPSNVIVTHHSGVKLIDFGIATAKSRKEQTAVGMLKGKAAYMSPEQCRGKKVDRRSDVFALGIMMYEMTTMVRPFEGDSHLAVMHQICAEDPKLPSKVRDPYPKELERVVMRALDKDPAKRFQTAFELLEELERVTRDTKLHALPGALARYLEHLFGPEPHPWQNQATPPPVRAGRADLDTTETAQPEPKPNTSTITQPKLGKTEGEKTESPDDVTVGSAADVGQVPPPPVVTEQAVPAISEEEMQSLIAATPKRSSSAMIVMGSVVFAAVVVAGASWYSSRNEAPPVEAGGSAARSSKPLAAPASPPSTSTPAPTPTEAPSPVPTPAVTPVQPAATAVESDEILFEAEAEAPPVPEPDPADRSRGRKKREDARKAAEARKLLDEARHTWLKDAKKGLALAKQSLALKRTGEGYSLMGMIACRLGDSASAKKAYRNLRGSLRSSLAQQCRKNGVAYQ